MTTVQDFAKIETIDGVKGYYLVKYDGSGIVFKGDNAGAVFPFAAFSGLNCEAFCPLLGFSKFKHAVFARKSREDVIVFSLSNYFLAVIKEADAPVVDVTQKVDDFIRAIFNTNPTA